MDDPYWLNYLGFQHVQYGDTFDNWKVVVKDRHTRTITLEYTGDELEWFTPFKANKNYKESVDGN